MGKKTLTQILHTVSEQLERENIADIDRIFGVTPTLKR
jgi:hypothetical protein